MTNAQMTYDLLLRLNQNSDDSEIGYRQAIMWLSVARDSFIRDYLAMNGNEIPPSMITRVEDQAMTVTTDSDGCTVRYIDLPYDVMDLKDDIGVYNVLRPKGKPVHRQSSSGLSKMLCHSRFNDKTSWNRVSNRVYLEGSFPEGMTFDLDLIPASAAVLAETDPFPAPSELLMDILEEAEKIGRRELGGNWDYSNDGAGDPVVKGS